MNNQVCVFLPNEIKLLIGILLAAISLQACVSPTKESAKTAPQDRVVKKAQKGQQAQLVTQLPHVNQIQSIDYADEQDFFITGGKDSSIKIWKSDGQLIRTVNVGFWVDYVKIFAKDQFALLGSRTGSLAIVKINNGGLIRLPKQKGLINSLAVAPNGSVYAVSMNDGRVFINTLDGKNYSQFGLPPLKPTKRKVYKNAVTPAEHISFMQNSSVLLGANYYGELMMWDLKGKLIYHQKLSEMPVKSIAAHKSNKIVVAFGLPPGNYRKYSNLKMQSLIVDFNKKERPSTVFRAPPLLAAEISPNGDKLYAIAKTGTSRNLLTFDMQGKELHRFRLSKDTHGAKDLAVSPDGKRIVVIDNKINPTRIIAWSPRGKQLLQIAKPLESISDLALNPLDYTLAAGSHNQTVKLLSIHGKYLGAITTGSPANTLAFSGDGKRLLVGTNKNIQVWDYQRRKKLQSLRAQRHGSGNLAISHDDQYLASVGGAGQLRVYRKQGGRYALYSKKKLSQFRVQAVSFSNDGKAIAVGLIREGLKYVDRSGNTLWEIKSENSRDASGKLKRSSKVCAISHSASGDKLAALSRDSVTIYTTQGRKLLRLPQGARYNICDVRFVLNDKYLMFTSGRDVALWDWQARQKKAVYRGHTGPVTSLATVKGTSLLASGSSDSHMRLWNLASGYSAAVVIEKGEWVIYDRTGYFDASRKGGEILKFSKNLDSYPADQFALYYNRPDIIYSKLGIASEAYRKHLLSQYKRRINKALINETYLSPDITVPKLSLNRKERIGNQLRLYLSFNGNNSKLKYYQVYNNNVPLYGRLGKALTGSLQDVQEEVTLLSGNNHIEVSVVNENGIESLRVSTNERLKNNQQANLYFVGLGVSTYKNTDLNLKYAAKDVSDIRKLLDKQRGQYANIYSKTYLNKQVTKNILSEIHDFLAKATAHDSVILFLSGHGAYERDSLSEYYYLTHDSGPDNMREKGIAWSDIEDLLFAVKPNRKLVFMDTCESGEMDVANQIKAFRIARKKGFNARANQILGDIKNHKRERRKYLYYKDRYIYNDLVKGSGAVVFSSSAGGEMSFETKALKNGFFTHALKSALGSQARKADSNRDGRLSISELVSYVEVAVSRYSGGLQNPTVDRGNPLMSFDFQY